MNVNRVRQRVSEYLDYDMIRQYTDLPPFPGDQVRLMLSFLHPDLQHGGRGELYSLVTSLVQIGLDAHDRVEAKDGEPGLLPMRAKQLKVLAGDYFSGRYYELLASAEDIEAVGTMSDAISDVNILKMNLYLRKLQRDLSGDQYLQQLLAIRTRLFLAFESEIIGEHRQYWRQLLDGYTWHQILQDEYGRLLNVTADYDGWAIWELLHTLPTAEKVKYEAALQQPEQLEQWIRHYRLQEQLEAMIEEAARHFIELADVHTADKQSAESVASLVESVRREDLWQYSYDTR